jgi:hypothetical protein
MMASFTSKAAEPRLGRVSAIGGWGVYEPVEPRFAMESLDVDVLIRDTATCHRSQPLS